MTDAGPGLVPRRSASGGLAEPFDPPQPDTPSPLNRLHSLQKERYRLDLRKIEIGVELAELDRRLQQISAEAPIKIQGPVEAIRFAQNLRRVSELHLLKRANDQRLRRLELEIATAIGMVARSVRGR